LNGNVPGKRPRSPVLVHRTFTTATPALICEIAVSNSAGQKGNRVTNAYLNAGSPSLLSGTEGSCAVTFYGRWYLSLGERVKYNILFGVYEVIA
jgi:hypothetical protein